MSTSISRAFRKLGQIKRQKSTTAKVDQGKGCATDDAISRVESVASATGPTSYDDNFIGELDSRLEQVATEAAQSPARGRSRIRKASLSSVTAPTNPPSDIPESVLRAPAYAVRHTVDSFFEGHPDGHPSESEPLPGMAQSNGTRAAYEQRISADAYCAAQSTPRTGSSEPARPSAETGAVVTAPRVARGPPVEDHPDVQHCEHTDVTPSIPVQSRRNTGGVSVNVSEVSEEVAVARRRSSVRSVLAKIRRGFSHLPKL